MKNEIIINLRAFSVIETGKPDKLAAAVDLDELRRHGQREAVNPD